MADDIIQFAPGGKVTAEETNANNLLLKEWALDNSASETYIDSKIATLSSSLDSQISSINTQLGNCVKTSGSQTISGSKTFSGTVKVPESITANSAISLVKRGTHYIQLGDGLKLQWGNDTGDKYISFPLQYTSYCEVFLTDLGPTNTRDVQKVKYKELKRFYAWTAGDDDSYCWFAIGR